MKDQNYVLYRLDRYSIDEEIIPDLDLTFEIWEPAIHRIKPKGTPLILGIWWIYFFPKILIGSRSYLILMGSINHRMACYVVATTKCFKYPFMTKNDIQIGPYFTDEEYRNKGIASMCIGKFLAHLKSGNGQFYSIVREQNLISNRIQEKLRFDNCGVIEIRNMFNLITIFGTKNRNS